MGTGLVRRVAGTGRPESRRPHRRLTTARPGKAGVTLPVPRRPRTVRDRARPMEGSAANRGPTRRTAPAHRHERAPRAVSVRVHRTVPERIPTPPAKGCARAPGTRGRTVPVTPGPRPPTGRTLHMTPRPCVTPMRKVPEHHAPRRPPTPRPPDRARIANLRPRPPKAAVAAEAKVALVAHPHLQKMGRALPAMVRVTVVATDVSALATFRTEWNSIVGYHGLRTWHRQAINSPRWMNSAAKVVSTKDGRAWSQRKEQLLNTCRITGLKSNPLQSQRNLALNHLKPSLPTRTKQSNSRPQNLRAQMPLVLTSRAVASNPAILSSICAPQEWTRSRPCPHLAPPSAGMVETWMSSSSSAKISS